MTTTPFPDRPAQLSRLAGSCVGLFTFAAMVFVGLWCNNPVETIVLRALGGLFAATLLGFIAGALAEQVLRDNGSDARAAHSQAAQSTTATKGLSQ